MSREQEQRVLEGVVLRWLARLPLLREEDVPKLTGKHEADTRRALQTLMRCGWIERVRLRSPEVPEHPRYLLRAEAVPRFAEAFVMDEDQLRRGWPVGHRENLAHVTHFEITDFVNGLLVSLVQNARQANFEVDDVRTLPHARRATESWCPSLLEGYGCLGYKDSFAHFFVGWDRTAAPTIHRRARVRAWYDAFEAANHWGEYLLPPILLVLPSRRLEAEWRHLVDASARRRDVEELDVLVTDEGEAYNEVAGTIWRRLGESGATSLLRALHWSSNPPPVHVPQTARFDLIARGVPVREPTLHEWADWVLQRESGPRDRSAALALRLEAYHRDLRELLARHPLLGVEEIAGRMGVPAPLVRRVLRDLERYGLIGGLEVPADPRR